MGFENFNNYERAAIEFANSNRGVTHIIGNKIYRFDEKTAELVIFGKDKNLISFFKPKNGDLEKSKSYYDNYIKNNGGKEV